MSNECLSVTLTINCRQLTQKWFDMSRVRSSVAHWCRRCCVLKLLAHLTGSLWLKSSLHRRRVSLPCVTVGWRCDEPSCLLLVLLSDKSSRSQRSAFTLLHLNPNYDVTNDVISGFAKVVAERCGFRHWTAERISWGEVVSIFLYLL